MKLQYREIRATQAAAMFLTLGGATHVMKLITLLYFVDRQAILEWGRPVTFDELWLTQGGPVLRTTLANIHHSRVRRTGNYWSQFVTHCAADNTVSLRTDLTARDQLSPADEQLIVETHQEFSHLSLSELRKYAREHFPEAQRSRTPGVKITIRALLLANGRSVNEIAEIEHDLRGAELIHALCAA